MTRTITQDDFRLTWTDRPVTVSLSVVCPHCGEGFPIGEPRSLDNAQAHIRAHLEGEPHPDGG